MGVAGSYSLALVCIHLRPEHSMIISFSEKYNRQSSLLSSLVAVLGTKSIGAERPGRGHFEPAHEEDRVASCIQSLFFSLNWNQKKGATYGTVFILGASRFLLSFFTHIREVYNGILNQSREHSEKRDDHK